MEAFRTEQESDNEPFQITTCVLGAAQRKQLHHHCNKYHLQSSSSGPEGQRRITILSEWRFAPEKPMAPSVGDGAIDFLVARTKDGSAEMLRGKVTGPCHRGRDFALDASVSRWVRGDGDDRHAETSTSRSVHP